MTQEEAAERAKMSAFIWIKLNVGDVSVSLGSWLSALECLGLLNALSLAPMQPAQTLQGTARIRPRPSPAQLRFLRAETWVVSHAVEITHVRVMPLRNAHCDPYLTCGKL